MWLLFAVLSGAFFTAQGLLSRHVLKGDKDAWAFSFFFSLVGAVVSLPFMLADFKVPHTPLPWMLAIFTGLLIVGHNWLYFKSANSLEASLGGTIGKARLVWVFILSIVFLGMPFSWQKLGGTILTVIAGLIILHGFKRPKSFNGVIYALVATLLNAGLIIIFKSLLTHFSAASLTFFASFLPAMVLNFVLMPRASQRIRRIYKIDGRMVLLACGLGAVANLAMNQGLALGDANSVVVITEVFLIVTLVGEHILLQEKEQTWIKVAAVLLATAGAILIQTA